MDDIQRNLKVTIGGKEYAAAPLNEGQLTATQLIKAVPDAAKLRVISGLFRGALGDDARVVVHLLEVGQDLTAQPLELLGWKDGPHEQLGQDGDGAREVARQAFDRGRDQAVPDVDGESRAHSVELLG